MALKDALKELNGAIKDLSSLHVQTFTGSVKFNSATQKYTDISSAISTAQNDKKITLVAESLYKFDGDSYNFVTADDKGIPDSAMELHRSAVEGGIKTRQALAELVKDAFE